MMNKPLENIRVLDCSAFVAGPFCTMFLADLGAEVIKIEPPWGDRTRMSAPLFEGESNQFMFLNRNKKSLILNLKDERAKKIFKELVLVSDVVIENFRPGVMDRLGIGYNVLKEINPRIIFASISGYGQDGPYVKRPSFNLMAQALSGWMSVVPRSAGPNYTGEVLGDTAPALICAISILAALNYRNVTGEGERIDVAQMDSLISMMTSITFFLQSGITLVDKREKYSQESIYGMYKAKDGYVTIRAIGAHLEKLSEVVGRDMEDLLSPSTVLDEWIIEKGRDEVVSLLNEVDVPCAPVLYINEVIENPNVKAREMIVQIKHSKGFTYSTTGCPIKYTNANTKVEKPSPILGQHSKEILSSILTYSLDEIIKLREDGVTYFPI